MKHSLLIQMYKNIDKFEKQDLLSSKFIVVFGSNEPAERIMEYLQTKNIKVNAIVDNNKKKDGTLLNGIKVTVPNKLLLPKIDNAVILIASKYYPEMVVQLNNMGYEEGTNILKVVEYSSFSTFNLTEEEFDRRYNIVLLGKEIYKKINSYNPYAQKIFVCPVGALGDAYIGMSFIKEYISYCNIKEFTLVLINGACSKIASLFGLDKNMYPIKEDEMTSFVQYAVFNNMENERILLLNHRYPYTCRIGEIGNYKNINFTDHFRYSIFNLPEGSKPEVPSSNRNNEEKRKYVKRLFKEIDLLEGKTIILFPYAKIRGKT